MTITSVIILLLAASCCLLRSRSSDEHKSVPSPRSPYLATSIRSRECSCSAVKVVGDKRFLSSGVVPRLPLPECTAEKCQCSYVRHQDRRNGTDERRAVYSLQTDLYSVSNSQERRAKTGRRESDGASGIADMDYNDFEWTT